MATQQSAGGVPFAVQHEFEQFRLMELPPELVALLDAPDPPRLTIKSQAPSATASAQAAYAVLCTPSKTYQLRQVQTSNSLFVTRPTLDAHGNDVPVPTTRAIASCAATLELHPAGDSPTALLEQVLPAYDLVDGDADAHGNGKRKADIFPDIPFSEGECEQAWKALMAFESAGSSFRPTANTLAQVWRAITAAAVAEGVKLGEQFLTDDLASTVAEEGHPETLVEAVLHGLSAGEQSGRWSCLDRSKTVQFVGKTLLQARREGSDYLTADFVDAWKDSLPEIWREDAELKAINGVYDLPSSTTVRLKGRGAGKAAEAPAANPKARKWHEKFGRTRQK